MPEYVSTTVARSADDVSSVVFAATGYAVNHLTNTSFVILQVRRGGSSSNGSSGGNAFCSHNYYASVKYINNACRLGRGACSRETLLNLRVELFFR